MSNFSEEPDAKIHTGGSSNVIILNNGVEVNVIYEMQEENPVEMLDTMGNQDLVVRQLQMENARLLQRNKALQEGLKRHIEIIAVLKRDFDNMKTVLDQLLNDSFELSNENSIDNVVVNSASNVVELVSLL